jgi:hypothetical protein
MADEYDEESGPDGMFVIPIRGNRPTRRDPESRNPDDYPRAIEVADEDLLFAFAGMSHTRDEYARLAAEIQALQEEAQVLDSKLAAQRTELFYRLRKKYPAIVKPSRPDGMSKVGWRKNGERYYFVGWDIEP